MGWGIGSCSTGISGSMVYPSSIEWNPVKDKSKSNKIKRNSKIHDVGPVAEKVICRECGLDWNLHKYRNPYECIRLLKAQVVKKTPFDCSGFVNTGRNNGISWGTNTVPSFANYTNKIG